MQYSNLDPWYRRLWCRYGIHWFVRLETGWSPYPNMGGYTRFSGPMWAGWLITALIKRKTPPFGLKWIMRLLWFVVRAAGAHLEYRPSPFNYSWPEMKACLKSYAFAGWRGTYSLIELYSIPFVFDVHSLTKVQRGRLTRALIEQLSKHSLVIEQTIFDVHCWVPTERGKMLMGVVNPLVAYETNNPYSYVSE